jgi:hypothetical protein
LLLLGLTLLLLLRALLLPRLLLLLSLLLALLLFGLSRLLPVGSLLFLTLLPLLARLLASLSSLTSALPVGQSAYAEQGCRADCDCYCCSPDIINSHFHSPLNHKNPKLIPLMGEQTLYHLEA